MIYVKLLTGERIMESVSDDTTVAEIMSRMEEKQGKIVETFAYCKYFFALNNMIKVSWKVDS